MKHPGAYLTNEIGFTQKPEDSLGHSLIMWPLASTPSLRSLFSVFPQEVGADAPWSLFLLKINAIINYLQALGQHFHILLITHSVSVKGKQRHLGFTQKHLRGLGWHPSRQSLDLSIQPERTGGTGKMGWTLLGPHRQPEREHLNSSGTGTQELFFPAHHSARTLTLDSISLFISRKWSLLWLWAINVVIMSLE